MSGSIPTLTITPFGVSPGHAAAAYSRTSLGGTSKAPTGSFAAAVDNAISDAISLGRNADNAAMQAIAGRNNITAAVTAVSRAELALQATTAIRDKVVNAYQTIMDMPI